jgi:hypothetical protein
MVNNLEKEEIRKGKKKQKNERKALTLIGLLVEGVSRMHGYYSVNENVAAVGWCGSV